MVKKVILTAAAFLALGATSVRADQGMWLLPFIEQLNIEQMKDKGFRLEAKDVYSINNSSLKDAIVIFGRGCTGEFISSQGLVLTNHHCGYPNVQGLSTVENDYLKDGFWAESLEKELPCPGLTVTSIKQIVDVTNEVMEGVNSQMSESERNSIIESNIAKVSKQYDVPSDGITANIKPMYGGNQYLLFQNQIFTDVRMVGVPPQSIGKFGGEADNWMWPRHTGDFSMFRVYASKDGKPAAYSKDNVPFTPVRHLEVSMNGYENNDYAMIMGFPGRTNRYMTTWEIDQVLEQDNPIRIFVRGERQKLMWEDMLSSDKIRIQYADKYVTSANHWKNSIGMSRGLNRLNVRDTKQAGQDEFTAWVNDSEQRKAQYSDALPMIEKAVELRRPLRRELQLLSETIITPGEIYKIAASTKMIVDNSEMSIDDKKETLRKLANGAYKDYNTSTDRKILKRMLEIYIDSIPSQQRPEQFMALTHKNIDSYLSKLYKTPFASKEAFLKMAESGKYSSLSKDVAVIGAHDINKKGEELTNSLVESEEMFARGHRLYLGGLLEMNKGVKSLSPDANFTIRMTYGNVLPYKPMNGVTYDYYTTLAGVMEKENPEDPEFVVPSKLKELWNAKDFGPYAVNGDVPVALITNNDITGGNSGSPIMNSKGQLIGLAFDGNWEALTGDIAFEDNVQRTIGMDVRYLLFLIDKFAGADRLIDEMTIVK